MKSPPLRQGEIPDDLPDDASLLMGLYRRHAENHSESGSTKHAHGMDRISKKWRSVSVVSIVAAHDKRSLFRALLYADPLCEETPNGIERLLEYGLEAKDAGRLLAIASRFTSHNSELCDKLIDKVTELLQSDEGELSQILSSVVYLIKRTNKHNTEEDLALSLLPIEDLAGEEKLPDD